MYSVPTHRYMTLRKQPDTYRMLGNIFKTTHLVQAPALVRCSNRACNMQPPFYLLVRKSQPTGTTKMPTSWTLCE